MEEANTAPQDDQIAPQAHPDPCLYCPLCSKRLTEHKCKLHCETCGYFMSCADFY